MEEDSGTTERSPEVTARGKQETLRSGSARAKGDRMPLHGPTDLPGDVSGEQPPVRTGARETQRILKRNVSRQLAGVEDLVASFSHEIRNPLASILAGLQTLERVGSLVPDDRFVLGLVIGEARTAVKIVDRFRDSVRRGVRSLSRIELGELLAETLNDLTDAAEEKGISLSLVPVASRIWVTADGQALARALKNLLQNALEACQNGDSIRAGWREMSEEEIASVLPGFQGRVAVIFGEDTGVGLPCDQSESSVFEPFVTTKAGRSGLGLPIVREIVESHAGAVRLQPLAAGGVRFEILLPAGNLISCWEARDKGICPSMSCPILCDTCEVQSGGVAKWCWMDRSQASGAQGDDLQGMCTACPVFRELNVGFFFQTRDP